ncbi:uncharacterized protein LOC129589470 [Paramacrobiotus metropolitanus]|uniref:uncharacterized protein LOC129589470 n=1 Tax=Paramacrobiotus metropolitanus TaxID=2943436 RepID=UPI00244592E0|nr:uncharacterized protein LOC129589470 [Paramacrobiotus metropolitanus]
MRSGFYGDPEIANPVEVLMQRSPSEPWTWQPATLLVHDRQYGQFGLAVIYLSSGDVRSIVRLDRIRHPNVMAPWSWKLHEIPESGYVKDNLQFYNESVLRPLAAETTSACSTKDKKPRPAGDYLATKKWWKVFLACCGRSTSPAPKSMVPAPGRAFRLLPMEILTETLQCLPTVDQCRLRAVCTVWNRLLKSTAVQSLLHIEFPSKSDLDGPCSVYIAVACAHRCWSNRVVAVKGSPVQGDSQEKLRLNELPLCDGRFLHTLIEGAVEKFPHDLVLQNINCQYVLEDTAVDYILTLQRVFDQLAAVCHTLTVKNFTCEIFQSVQDVRLPITIHIPFGRMRRDWRPTVVDWWEMIEKGCPLLDEEQKRVVFCAIWKRKLHSVKIRSLLRKIIRARQTNDPRKGVTYLKPFPTGENALDFVDVNRLTRLTAYLLYCAITNTPFTCNVTWPTALLPSIPRTSN